MLRMQSLRMCNKQLGHKVSITCYWSKKPGWIIYAEKNTSKDGLWWKGGLVKEESGDIYPFEQIGACYLFDKLSNIKSGM